MNLLLPIPAFCESCVHLAAVGIHTYWGVHFTQLETQQQFVSSFFYSVLETCSQFVLHRKAFHTTDFLFVSKRKALYRTYFQCVWTRKAFYTTLLRVVLNRKTSYTTDFRNPNFCIKSKNILYN